METIDNRLDFYNAVKKYAETIDTEDEFVIVMSYSKRLSDVITIVHGNLGYAINLITDENPVYDLKQIEVKWVVLASFQLVGEEYQEGWVHRDENICTGIIYLSNQVCNSGTTLYRPIDPVNAVLKNANKKYESFNNTDLVTSVKNCRLENNKQFRPTVTIENEYNRLVLFDSHLYHSANNFYGSEVESNRLTLVFFVNRLDFNTSMSETTKTPISRSRTFCL